MLILCLPCFIALEEHIFMPITVHLAVKCSCLHLNASQNDRAKGDSLQLKHRNCTACFDIIACLCDMLSTTGEKTSI